MRIIKDKIDYIAIVFAILAIISCLLPFAIFSVTNNGYTTSTNISYISVDGIYVVASLILIIVLLILKRKFPQVAISILILTGLSLGLTIYEVLNVDSRVASTITIAYEDVKIGYGCFMTFAFLILLLATLVVNRFVISKQVNVNLQVNDQSNVVNSLINNQNANVNSAVENQVNTINNNEINDVNPFNDMSLYGQNNSYFEEVTNGSTYQSEESLNLVPENKYEEIEELNFDDEVVEDIGNEVPAVFVQYPEIIDEHVSDEIEVLEFSDDDEIIQNNENEQIIEPKQNTQEEPKEKVIEQLQFNLDDD